MQITTPIYRSSIQFKVRKIEGYSIRLLYMGYWMLNQGHKEIAQVLTIYSKTGEPRYQTHTTLTEAKAYSIDLSTLPLEEGGSVELEFYSTRDQFSDTPRVLLNIYNSKECVLKSYFDFELAPKGLIPFKNEDNPTTFTGLEEISTVEIYSGFGELNKTHLLSPPSRTFSTKELNLEKGEWAAKFSSDFSIMAHKNGFSYPLQQTQQGTFALEAILADQPDSVLWILNPLDISAVIDVYFYRVKDDITLERPVILPPNGFIALKINEDPELRVFFAGKPGWAALFHPTGHINSYSFTANLKDDIHE